MASNPAIASRLQSDALVGRVAELGSLGGSARCRDVMSRESIVFDSVSFWDMAGERRLSIAGSRSITEMAMVPMPGDRIRFEGEEQQFMVVYREFTFRNGIVHILVNVQPAAREP